MKRKALALTLVLALLFSAIAGTHFVKPVNARTIAVPDDYSTIQDAINAAINGDTIFVRNGSYEGEIDQTLVIDKSISLIGENSQTTINLHPNYTITWILTASFLSSADALLITANDVKISNLTLTYTGDIRVDSERVQFIDINLQSRSTVTGLVISGSECILTENFVFGRVSIESSSNLIFGNNFYSLRVDSGSNNMIESNNLHYLKLKRSNFNAISKNNISTDLVSPVIDIRNSSHNVLFNNNITSHLWNTNLNIDGESHNNTVCENNFLCPAYTTLNSSDYFYSNKEIVSIDSTAFSNFWENNRVGNYWQNYHGSDANGDGIGDTPYAIDGDNVDNYPLMYPFDIEGDAVVLPPPEPFPTTLIIVAVIVVGVVLAIYLKKRKHQTGMVEVK